MLWDITISKRLDRYLQRVKVNGAQKSLFTLSVTLAFTLANEQMPRQERVAHVKKVGITYFSFVFTIFFSL
jgi:hypothetical protein